MHTWVRLVMYACHDGKQASIHAVQFIQKLYCHGEYRFQWGITFHTANNQYNPLFGPRARYIAKTRPTYLCFTGCFRCRVVHPSGNHRPPRIYQQHSCNFHTDKRRYRPAIETTSKTKKNTQVKTSNDTRVPTFPPG